MPKTTLSDPRLLPPTHTHLSSFQTPQPPPPLSCIEWSRNFRKTTRLTNSLNFGVQYVVPCLQFRRGRERRIQQLLRMRGRSGARRLMKASLRGAREAGRWPAQRVAVQLRTHGQGIGKVASRANDDGEEVATALFLRQPRATQSPMRLSVLGRRGAATRLAHGRISKRLFL